MFYAPMAWLTSEPRKERDYYWLLDSHSTSSHDALLFPRRGPYGDDNNWAVNELGFPTHDEGDM